MGDKIRTQQGVFLLSFVLFFLFIGLVSSTLLELTLNDSTDLISGWMNRTSVGSLGAGLDGPLLFMDFNKDAEGTYVQDNSINNNFGTNNGATYNSSCGVTDAGNDLGGCYEFDGTNDYISVVDDASLRPETISFFAWIKPNTDGTRDAIVTSGLSTAYASNNYIFALNNVNNRFTFFGRTPTSQLYSNNNVYTLNEWNHVGFVSEGGTLTFYSNGMSVGSVSATTGTDNTNGLKIGEDTTGVGNYFDGQMDNIQIFDRALTASEIQNLYNGTTNNTNYYGKYANEGNFTSLVFYNSTLTHWNVTQSIADSTSDPSPIFLDNFNSGSLNTSAWSINLDDGNNFADVADGRLRVGGVLAAANWNGAHAYTDAAFNLSEGVYLKFKWRPHNSHLSSAAVSSLKFVKQGANREAYYNHRDEQFLGIMFDTSSWTSVIDALIITDAGTAQGSSFGSTRATLSGIPTLEEWNDVEVLINPSTRVAEVFLNKVSLGTGTFNEGNWNSLGGEYILEFSYANYNREEWDGFDDIELYTYADRPSILDVSSGRIAYFDMDETHVRATGTNAATGISGAATRFDGSDDVIDVSQTVSGNYKGISMWFYNNEPITAASSRQSLLCTHYTTAQNGYACIELGSKTGVYLANEIISVQVPVSNTYFGWCDASASISVGWHHLVVTHNSTQYNIYLDDELKNDCLSGSLPSTNYLRTQLTTLGGNIQSGTPAYSFNGIVDEVLVFSAGLSDSQRDSLRKYGLSRHANANVSLQTRVADSYNISGAGLVGLWGLNGDADDELGVNNGTVTGATAGDEYGVVGQGYDFDGDEMITIPDDSSLDITSAITISSWVKSNGASNYAGLVTKDPIGSNRAYSLQIQTSGLLRWRANGLSDVDIDGTMDMDDGVWHHIVTYYNGSELGIYIDGEKHVSTPSTGSISSTSANLAIGHFTDVADGDALNGSIDEVRIYNRSLSTSEIQDLYELGSSHIEWSDWEDEGVMSDGVGDKSSSPGNFIQFRDVFATDTTNVSAYILNYNVAEIPDEDAPIISVSSPVEDYNYSVNTTDLNLTLVDGSELDTCLYSISGAANQTMACGGSISVLGLIFTEGDNNITIFSNDTLGYGATYTVNFTVDLTNASINATSYADGNETANSVVNFTLNVSDVGGSGVENASLFVYWDNDTLYYTAEIVNLIPGAGAQIISKAVNFVDGIFKWFVDILDFAGNRNYTSNRTLTIDLTAPNYTGYVTKNTPLFVGIDNATLDPDTIVYVNVTVTDPNVTSSTTGIDSAYLIWDYTLWNGTSGSGSQEMSNLSDVYYGNFTTVPYNSSYTYYVSMNDSVGNVNVTDNTTIYSNWDCTWSIYTDNDISSTMGTSAGFDEVGKNIRTMFINNTGDYNHSKENCRLKVSFLASQNSDLFSYNNGNILYVDANSSTNFPVNYTFGATQSNFDYDYTATARYGDTAELFDSRAFEGSILTQQDGPYLVQEVADNDDDNIIYINNETLNLSAYIQNAMGNGSAYNSIYNLSSNWTIPSVFTNTTGSLTYAYDNLINDSQINQNLVLNYTNVLNMTTGFRTFYMSSVGYSKNLTSGNYTLLNQTSATNGTFNDSFSLYFACYTTADGVPVWDCINDDPDTVACGNGYINNKAGVANESCDDGNVVDGDGCDSSCQTEPETISSGGSSGGGGGGGGASGDKFSKSEGTFELLNGEALEFYFAVENKGDKPKTVGEIFVKGDNAQYITIKQGKGEKVSPGEKLNITLEINAPAYFPSGKHLLQFDVVLKDSLGTSETVQKFMTLYILDVSRTEADAMMLEARNYLDWMEIRRLDIDIVEELFNSMNSDYSTVSFESVQNNFEELEGIVLSAKEFIEFNSTLLEQIEHAKDFDINVFETKKLWLLANVIFNRGDYILAKQRINEAQSMYAYETKGEFGAVYYARKNPLQAFSALIVLFGVGLFGGFMSRKVYLSRKIKLLKKEEKLLLELMELVQRYTFKDNKMMMGEYYEAMSQYEAKLSKTIAERIKTESALTTLTNLKSKKEALALEKKRLVEMMRDLQDQYLNKGSIETRVYENMLKTYASRLGSVGEELVYLETKKMLRKGGL